MPNRRVRVKVHRRQRNGKDKSTKKIDPAFIDNFIKNFNETNKDEYQLKKFLVYDLERQLYGPDKTKEFVVFCIRSYFIVKYHYEYIEYTFNLLPIELIEESFNFLKFGAGINEEILELIKIKTEYFNVQNKMITLIMDETTIHPQVQYDVLHDNIVGFADNGKVRTQNFASYVTTIWISCVGAGTWQTPFAYILTENSASVEEIKDFLFDSITKLRQIDLDVVGIVTKMRTNFYNLAEELNISPQNQTFQVGDHDVLFMFDVPQLMNITRNNLMKYIFKFDDMETSWQYIKEVFRLEQENEINKKTKLTIDHLKPNNKTRRKPRYAIELLSNSVANEMKECIASEKLPESAAGTAEFIDTFDKLFDILNSLNETTINEYNSSFKGTKHQNRFMEKMIKFFENLKVFDNESNDCTDKVKFIKGWLITIKSVLQLWNVVKNKGGKYLLTRNINCELTDNWTLSATAFLSKMPTAFLFLEMYNQIFKNYYFHGCPVDENDARTLNMDSYVNKIYRYIPPRKHDLKDTNVQVNEPCQDESAKVLKFLDKFVAEYSDIF